MLLQNHAIFHDLNLINVWCNSYDGVVNRLYYIHILCNIRLRKSVDSRIVNVDAPAMPIPTVASVCYINVMKIICGARTKRDVFPIILIDILQIKFT